MSSRNMMIIGLVVLVVLALVALGLCGRGGTTEEAGKATTSPTSKAATSAPTSAATTAPKAAATTAPAGGGSAAGAGELASALASFQKAEYKATYELSGIAAAGGPTSITMSKLGDKTRFEITAQGQSMTMIQAPPKSYMCQAEARSCFEVPAAGGPVSNPAQSAIQSIGSGANAKAVAGRTIAGIAAKCYEFSEQGQGSGTTCVGPDGQLLAVESTTPQGVFKMTATKIEPKPSAADFEPPYPVTQLPGLPGGLPGGVPGGLPTPPRQ